MRKQLAKMDNVRATFRGVFERFGVKSGWNGRQETTVLLKDITDATGKRVCDHLWFNLTKQFKSLHLEPGDVVQFDARVRQYTRGYRGWREDVYDKPVETDYKLSYPTRVVRVSTPTAQPDAEAARPSLSLDVQGETE